MHHGWRAFSLRWWYNERDFLNLALIRRRRPRRHLWRKYTMNILKRGDEAAVLPQNWAAPRDVLDIAEVVYAGPSLIELDDGRLYNSFDGQSIHKPTGDCIVPATEEHRSALRAKLATTVKWLAWCVLTDSIRSRIVLYQTSG
jgi:hypothetical protein